jgi:putative flippase GtrA
MSSRATREAIGLARYGLVVGSGYLLAVAFYSGELALGIAPYLGLGIAFVLNGAYNFTLIRSWAFSPSGRGVRSDLTRFCAVAAISFGVNYAAFAVLYSLLQLAAAPAQRLAILLAAPVTFLGNRLWSFRASRAGGRAGDDAPTGPRQEPGRSTGQAGEEERATSARKESYSRM